MTRRRLLLFGALAAVILLLGILESQHIVSGWLRGAAFYRGRPTSYWRAEMLRWDVDNPRECSSGWSQKRPFWTDYLPVAWRAGRADGIFPPLPIFEDRAARSVLLELQQDPDPLISRIAEFRLQDLSREGKE